MKEKRKSPAAVKLLACLLLLASLAMLLLPWMKLAVDTNNGRMDMGELLGLLALLGLVALICCLTDHRGGIVPYLLLAVLATAAVVLARAGANRYLEEQGTALLEQWGAGMLLSFFGVDIHIVKMGIAAYLCPFLALLALLFMGIKKRRTGKKEAVSPYPARKTAESSAAKAKSASAVWTCPNCGSVRGEEEAFCIRCGTEKPKPPLPKSCPICGKTLPPDAAFCSICGAKL